MKGLRAEGRGFVDTAEVEGASLGPSAMRQAGALIHTPSRLCAHLGVRAGHAPEPR